MRLPRLTPLLIAPILLASAAIAAPAPQSAMTEKSARAVPLPSSNTVQAHFEVTPKRGQAPLNVRFWDRSIGPVSSWHWDFGDGNTSADRNACHHYEEGGVYEVSLTVSGLDGESRVSKPRGVLIRDCPSDSARANQLNPLESGHDFVPITGDDSLGFYCVYSGKAVSATDSSMSNNVGIFILPLDNGEILVYGAGYGDSNSFVNATKDAEYDVRRVDAIIRFCLRRTPRDTPIHFVAPHGHVDHINAHFIRELRKHGYPIAQIAFHQNDFNQIRSLPAWTSEDRAQFRQLRNQTAECQEELLGFDSPLGRVWFFSRPGHTPGAIDMVIDIRDEPTNRFLVRGSGASFGTCPVPNIREAVSPHGNVRLTAPQPNVISVSPENISSIGGSEIVLSGTGFSTRQAGVPEVYIDGVAAQQVRLLDDQTVTCIAPLGLPGSLADIHLLNRNGQDRLEGRLTYREPPALGTVTPSHAVAFGGTLITLQGKGFLRDDAGTNTVTIAGAQATGVKVVSDTTLRCVTPAGPVGPARVTLANANGASILDGAWTFDPVIDVLEVLPPEGTALGGTRIQIMGAHFALGASTPSVHIGGTPALDIVRVDDTRIDCTVPPGPAGSSVDVGVSGENGEDLLPLAYAYFPRPTVTGVSPESTSQSGGSTVTITGTGFLANAAGENVVEFGTQLATTILTRSDGSITCTVPPGSPGQRVDVRVSNDNGKGLLVRGFRYHLPPVILTISPEQGPRAGGTTVALRGSGFQETGAGVTEVWFGPRKALDVVVHDDGRLTCTTRPNAGEVSIDVRIVNANGEDVAPRAYRFVTLPRITSIAPNEGPAQGGTLVTIHGSGFQGAGAGGHVVTFGGVRATNVRVVDNSTITCRNPFGRQDWTVNVAVTSENGSAILKAGYHYLRLPRLTSLQPSKGPTTGGTLITLQGSGFLGRELPQVRVGGQLALGVSVLGDGQLQCITPPGDAGAASVSVRTAGGSAILAEGYSYGNRGPQVSTLTPVHGSSLGGTKVELSGTGFSGLSSSLNQVTFGGNAATQVVAINDTRLTCRVPVGAPGSLADVRVVNPNGEGMLAAAYRYHLRPTLTGISPSSTIPLGGLQASIQGSGFVADGAQGQRVFFGTAEADQLVVHDDGLITCRIPPGESGAAVDIRLTTSNGNALLPGGFRYGQPPRLQLVAPEGGPPAGGIVVSVTGLGFADPGAGPTTLTFGGALATELAVLDDLTITCRIPGGPPGATVDVEITNDNGSDLLPAAFRYHIPPVIAATAPANGPAAGGTTVVLTGSGFLDDIVGENTVFFGSLPAAGVLSVNDAVVQAMAPAGNPGESVDLVLTNSNGTFLLPLAFRYNAMPLIDSFAPQGASSLGGAEVTILGNGFLADSAGTNRVFFGKDPATNVVVVDDQTLLCAAPSGVAGSDVVLRVENDNGFTSAPETFQYFDPPQVSDVTPRFGFSGGGTLVELHGTGFALALPVPPSVHFGAELASEVEVVNDGTLRCRTPLGPPGAVEVRVTNENGSDTLADAFEYDWAPTITDVTPTRGSHLGGSEVRIEGGGFGATGAGPLRVRFGSEFATDVRILDGFTLLCDAPAGPPGSRVNVLVFNARGSYGWSGFDYNPRPTLVSIDPAQGLPIGGTPMTLRGSGFLAFGAGAPTVLLADAPASAVTVVDDTTITCLSPPGPSRTDATVSVANSNGQAAFVDGFRWLRPEPGDLDSDGITDAILSGSETVFVFFGSDLGLIDKSTAGADAAFRPAQPETDFGARVATGDLNGDGQTDLAISAPLDDGVAADAGAVYVFLGPLQPSSVARTSASADAVFLGRRAGDQFGGALAIGDVNADGNDDLVIGAPFDDEEGTDAGTVFVFAGRPDLAGASADAAAIRLRGVGQGNSFGASVAIGDVSADGLGDLLVGATMEDANGGNAGAAYLFRGSPTLAHGTTSLALARIVGPTSGARFGTSAAIADFDGDGIGDLFVGAPEARLGGNRTGAIFCFAGTANLASGPSSGADATLWGESSFDRVGTSMALGDVDGDGRADLLASGALHDVPSANTGRAYLILGGDFLGGAVAQRAATVFVSEGSSADQFGTGLSILDLDADGLHEVLVGAPFNDGGAANSGRVYVFSGPVEATRSAVADDATFTGADASLSLGREASSQQ